MTTKNVKQERPNKTQQRRKQLIRLSNIARLKQKEGDPRRINHIIIEDFYSDEGHQDFMLFREWKKQGFKVKKGSKAFVVWGRKRKATKASDEENEETNYKFFPLAYLFSNQQVEPA